MTKEKKNNKAKKEEAEEELQEQPPQLLMIPQEGELSPMALRLQLLAFSKEVLEHQSHLSWETHKVVIDVSIQDIILGAREFLDFVYEE